MNCPQCQSDNHKRFGKDKKGNQRFRCLDCAKTFQEDRERPLGDMILSMNKAVSVIQHLAEGCSIRSTMRITGVEKHTILSLIEVAGEKCDYCSRAVIIADEGKELQITRAIRRMHIFNPIPSMYGEWSPGQATRNITVNRIIEDPVFKRSDKSYFIQLADCIAFALLKKEVLPTSRIEKYQIHKMFDQTIAKVCFRGAAPRDPLGIVRR